MGRMDNISSSKIDEYYTPDYAVEPILKWVKRGSKVWCPFDTEESLFVKLLRDKRGCVVIATHIINGEDFFTLEVPKCDYIISNPPFTKKYNVLKRLYEIKKPFAMLVSIQGLFESKKRFEMFKNNRVEILYLSRRVWYMTSYDENYLMKNAPFLSVYVCSRMLPHQINYDYIGKDKKDKKEKNRFIQESWVFFLQRFVLRFLR